MKQKVSNRFGYTLISLWLGLFVFGGNAWALTQSITLNPGWNAVYLEVNPDEKTWDGLFGELPITSIWGWNSQMGSSVEYIQDPEITVPEYPELALGIPETKPESFLTTLFVAQGGKAYLIKLDSEQATTWNVTGTPILPKIEWKPDALNLVGFHLEPGNEPFFQAFFEIASAHAGQDIYRLNSNGNWEKILNPATTQMKHGEAYWVYSKGPSDYVGPLLVNLGNGRGLEYGESISELKLNVQNLLPNENVTVEIAGNAPLYHWNGVSGESQGWEALSSVSLSATATEEKTVRLAANRASLAENAIVKDHLIVKDNGGMQVNVPVEIYQTNRKGLWVGNVLIREVSQPASLVDNTLPQATPAEFMFPIIVHHDQQGQVTLLREVMQMWKDSVLATDAETGLEYVEEPGEYVLVADPSLVSQFSGAFLRNGKPAGRRISSAAFSFSGQQNMIGAFGSTLSISLNIDAQSPTNPFKHQYHPDHNNLDERYENAIEEAYSVTRTIALNFTENDPRVESATNNFNIRWGDQQIGGEYTETLTGLHKQPIYVKGIFYLNRISTIDTLNGSL